MKNVKTLIAAAILSSMSFASFAAVEVQSTPEGQQKVGTISANAGTNLGSLEEQLAQKADEMGAKSFRITSVTGPNTLHGTAVIYIGLLHWCQWHSGVFSAANIAGSGV